LQETKIISFQSRKEEMFGCDSQHSTSYDRNDLGYRPRQSFGENHTDHKELLEWKGRFKVYDCAVV